jgi:hypothetical protein
VQGIFEIVRRVFGGSRSKRQCRIILTTNPEGPLHLQLWTLVATLPLSRKKWKAAAQKFIILGVPMTGYGRRRGRCQFARRNPDIQRGRRVSRLLKLDDYLDRPVMAGSGPPICAPQHDLNDRIVVQAGLDFRPEADTDGIVRCTVDYQSQNPE